MKNIEVILTPALLPYYNLNGKIIVIIDILRATSSMCVAFQTGVKRILPVSTPEESKMFKDFDFVIAAERNAEKVEGFDLGNSPFEYQNPLLIGKSIALTTTNGTKAVKQSKERGAAKIVIGSFLNLEFLCNWLRFQDESVILFCAGWNDKFNLEDTLFAGAVLEQLEGYYEEDCDSALAAKKLYEQNKENLEEFVRQASHAKRFKDLHSENDDVKFCLQHNIIPLLPVMVGEFFVSNKQ